MRFDTHRASAYLVEKLMQAGADILDDGGDIILLKDPSGARVSVHLIESPLPLYEMKTILTQNHSDDLHTLFIFWCPMLLPVDGTGYEPDDWMAAVLSLHSGKIYGYELFGAEVFVFPVYFEPRGAHYRVRYGDTLEAAFLECHAVHTSAPAGYWRVADFSPRPPKEYWHKTAAENAKPSPTRLAACYGILGVSPDDDPVAIKRAYRVLARKYHPDLNTMPDATERMQEINAAYNWIMRQFEEDTP